MAINWPDFFRKARALARFAEDKAGLSPEAARAFGERHAAAPLPRPQLKWLLRAVQARRAASHEDDLDQWLEQHRVVASRQTVRYR